MWNRKEKDLIRHKLLSDELQFRGKSKIYLCLPGEDALCIKTGIEIGILDKDSRIVGYEDKKIQKGNPVFNNLLTTLKDPIFNIFNQPIEIHNENIIKAKVKNIDFAFLDFCDSLGAEKMKWLTNYISDGFAEKSSIAISMSANLQTPPEIYKKSEPFLNKETKYEKFIMDRFKNRMEQPIDKDREKLIPCFLLCCALRKYDFTKAIVYRYQDLRHRPMLAIHLMGITKSQKDNGFPSIETILKGGDIQVKKSEVDWSEAGRKSWETRRANIKKAKRSLAAKKAWKTIRARRAKTT